MLVDADEPGGLFLTEVAGCPVVTHDRHFPVEVGGHLRQLLGHEIVMQHVCLGHDEAAHRRDLVAIATGCVHDVFAGDRSLLGHDLPFAVRLLVDFENPVAAADLGAQRASVVGERHGDARWVDVAFTFGPDTGYDVVEVVERVELLQLVRWEQLDRIADVLADAEMGLELVQLVVVVGHPDSARRMQRHLLAGLRGELVVELKGIVVEGRRGVITDRSGDLARSMPGGARGQLGLLDEDAVGPAFLRQVIEQ